MTKTKDQIREQQADMAIHDEMERERVLNASEELRGSDALRFGDHMIATSHPSPIPKDAKLHVFKSSGNHGTVIVKSGCVLLCDECGGLQYHSKGGPVCANGHGGASATKRPVDDLGQWLELNAHPASLAEAKLVSEKLGDRNPPPKYRAGDRLKVYGIKNEDLLFTGRAVGPPRWDEENDRWQYAIQKDGSHSTKWWSERGVERDDG